MPRWNAVSSRLLSHEPSVDETIEILKGIRKAYEEHHRLTISDEAIEARGAPFGSLCERPLPAG
jgi:hypothetical protein